MKKIISLAFVLLITNEYFAQKKIGFNATGDIFGTYVFTENKGQFNDIVQDGKPVLFAYDNAGEHVLFHPNGVTYFLEERHPLNERQKERLEHGKKVEQKPSDKYFVNVNWEGANSNIVIETGDKQAHKMSYGEPKYLSSCYKKITYKNVYPNIDIEYLLPERGVYQNIKYNIIVHPGGDIKLFKANYSGDIKNLKLKDGNLQIKTPYLTVSELAPKAFQNGKEVNCAFQLTAQQLSFNASGYDESQELLIDPWVTGLGIFSNNTGYDVDFDYAGNYYVYGGTGPFLIGKYNPSGTLIWTFNGTAGSWTNNGGYAGNFVVEKNSQFVYTGNGFGGGAGAVVVQLNSSGVFTGLQSAQNPIWDECWDMGFYCGNSSVYGLGGSISGNGSVGLINTTTGAVTANNLSGLGGNGQDVVSHAVDPQGNLFLLFASVQTTALDNKIMRVNAAFTGNLWTQPSTFLPFSESSNHNYPGGTVASNGFNALDANTTYLFYWDGSKLAAYNKATGGIITSITVPGLTSTQQGGIAVDECNNIYIGGHNSILCYNFSGSSFSANGTIPVSSYVTDIQYNSNNNLLYVSGVGFGGTYSAINSGLCSNITNTVSTICVGNNNGTAVLTLSTALPSPVITYSWSNSSGVTVSTTSNTSSLSNTVTSLTNGNYTVFAQINAPCGPVLVATLNINCTCSSTVIAATSSSCVGFPTSAINTTLNISSLAGFSTTPTFTWTGPAGYNSTSSVAVIPNATPGIYTIFVNSSSCNNSATVQVAPTTSFTPIIASTSVACASGNTGGASVTSVSGSTATSFTYTWNSSPPQFASGATGLVAGNYTVYVQDGAGCVYTASTAINQPAAILVAPAQTTSVSCFSGSNGAASANASGGVGGFTYNWLPSGGTAATATGLTAGIYTVNILDANSCPKTGTVQITQPTALALSANVISTVTCFGLSNGSIGSTASGGIGAYAYSWAPSGGTAAIANNVPAGNYTLTLTDINGCSKTATAQIIQPALLVATAAQVTSVSCMNGTNGSASVSASGGLGAYNYTWQPSAQTNTLATSLSANIYTVTVKDINNCTQTATAQIVQPTQVTAAAAQITSVSCAGGNNGSAQVTPGGGNGGYTYTWTPIGGNAATANNLTAGIYSVQVKDVNNCPSSATLQIVGPAGVTITAVQVTSVSCKNFSNGVAAASASGGAGGYTYSWTPTGVTTATNSGLTAGIYTVNIADANSCIISKTVQIMEPTLVTLSAAQTTSVLCNGGNNGVATATAAGGNGGYTYTWTPAGGNTAIANNLLANSYTVNITDVTGCTATAQATIIQPTTVSLTVISTNSVLCKNGNTGSAAVNAAGGIGAYLYSWAPSGGSSAIATGLTANTYTVSMQDANNCSTSTTLTIIEPTLLNVVATGTNVSCNGYSNGVVSATVAGGMGSYTYTWLPGGSNSANNTNLTFGTYTLQALDVNACPIQTIVTITQPSTVSISATNNFTSCYGSNSVIAANALGGNGGPYTYTWSNSNFVGAGPLPINNIITNQTYTVTAFDALGCTSPTLSINITALPPLILNGNQNTVCDGLKGPLNVNLTSPGNGGAYTYSWSNGYVSSSNSATVTGNYASQPNIYTVTVSDGCSTPAVAQVTMNVKPTPKGYFIANLRQGCTPLNVNLTAISNNPTTDSYNWNFGNGQSGTQNTGATSYANAGVYSVTLQITSQFGCFKDTIALNYFEAYPKPTALFSANSYTLNLFDPQVQFNNHSINASSYLWDFGDGTAGNNPLSTQVNPNYYFLNAGTYNVYLTAISNRGCTDVTVQTIVVEPDFEIYIPNAFTPNGDGINDTFYPKGLGLSTKDYQFVIFDRWGEQIYNTDALSSAWDGTVKNGKTYAKDDVYIYVIKVKDFKGKNHEFTGHVTKLE